MQALCCHCGTVRTFNSSYSGRNLPDALPWEPMNDSLEQLRRIQARGLYTEAEQYWRVLIGLKCSTCGDITRHAALRRPEHANTCEEGQFELDRKLADARSKLQPLGMVEYLDFDNRDAMLHLRHMTLDDSWYISIREGLSASQEMEVISWVWKAVNGKFDDGGWRVKKDCRTLTLEARESDWLDEVHARLDLLASLPA